MSYIRTSQADDRGGLAYIVWFRIWGLGLSLRCPGFGRVSYVTHISFILVFAQYKSAASCALDQKL